MKKLNHEQIQSIENYLKYKQVEYLDMYIEILDHLASETENLMQKKISFNTSFEQVKSKWDKQLSYSSSFWFGLAYTKPRFFLKNAEKVYKSTLKKMVIIALGISICMLLPVWKNIEVLTFIVKIYGIVFLLLIPFMGYIFYKIFKSPYKTVYSFILKTQFLWSLFYFIMFNPLINTSFPSFKDGLSYLNVIYLMACNLIMTVMFFSYKLYKEHKKYQYCK